MRRMVVPVCSSSLACLSIRGNEPLANDSNSSAMSGSGGIGKETGSQITFGYGMVKVKMDIIYLPTKPAEANFLIRPNFLGLVERQV